MQVNRITSAKVAAVPGELYCHEIADESGFKLSVGDEDTEFVSLLSPSPIAIQGRVSCETDNRWVTSSSESYGANSGTFLENAGTATDPNIEWEHAGQLVLPRSQVVAFTIAGRGSWSGTVLTDMELAIVKRTPTVSTAWESGIDADSEFTNVELYRDLFWSNSEVGTTQPAFTGTFDDWHMRKFLIGDDGVIDEPSFLSVYFKPVGTITSTTYFNCSYSWWFV